MTRPDTGPGTRVTIGACTFRRQDDLRKLLLSFADLNNASQAEIEFLVVDNDVTPSAQDTVAAIAETLTWPCRYVHEPSPGIPQARNRVLDECGDSDFLLFVDDDETVDPDLLDEHLRVQTMTGAHFVQGPCVMTVPNAENRWWLDTAFFRQETFPDGAARHESWTNNVLIDLAFLRASGVRFDARLRFAGGSDTVFFQDIVRAGGRGAFAAQAIVYEKQPHSRLTWRWVLRRQFRYGVTRANTFILREPRYVAFGKCMLRAIAMEVLGFGVLLTALYRGKRGLADGLALMARGSGVAMGFFGFRADEYARAQT
ncbi:glycosyltransferase family 2 protein [Roseovarius sp. Pro17]|uniref:glycosyltransferase family 2 protein n=1 Tax=Roseovarius sp. Pro17 TaxID=3108175 RepID=UPI002D76FFD2|nr:glycosyltransferase family 2 protein [Roseovarius sp. Pro17]